MSSIKNINENITITEATGICLNKKHLPAKNLSILSTCFKIWLMPLEA